MTKSIIHNRRPGLGRFSLSLSLNFLILFSPALTATALFAFQPASIPWKTFLERSELVVWVRLVRWERTKGGGNCYTFEVNKTYKGPALREIELTIPRSRSESIGPVGLSAEGFLFLRKKEGRWKTSAGGRSWWPHLYAMQPGYKSIIHTEIGMSLHDLPPGLLSLKKRFSLIKILIDRREHPFKANLYLRDEVDAFLSRTLKGDRRSS